MLRLRSLLSVLTALVLLAGVMALPARIAVARNAGIQHQAPDCPPSLLVAFDGDDDDASGGYEAPALVPVAAVHETGRAPCAAPTQSRCLGRQIRVADRRPSTLVGTTVLLI